MLDYFLDKLYYEDHYIVYKGEKFFINGCQTTFNDNQRAFTMRQAGMQLAKNSQYNLQQSLMGNEANYLR